MPNIYLVLYGNAGSPFLFKSISVIPTTLVPQNNSPVDLEERTWVTIFSLFSFKLWTVSLHPSDLKIACRL